MRAVDAEVVAAAAVDVPAGEGKPATGGFLALRGGGVRNGGETMGLRTCAFVGNGSAWERCAWLEHLLKVIPTLALASRSDAKGCCRMLTSLSLARSPLFFSQPYASRSLPSLPVSLFTRRRAAPATSA